MKTERSPAEERLYKAAIRNNKIWQVTVLILVAMAFMFESWPLAASTIPISIILFFVIHGVSGFIIGGQLTDAEIEQFMNKTEESEDDDEAFIQRTDNVIATGMVIGRFDAAQIYEWVDLEDTLNGGIYKFFYHSPLHFISEEEAQIPDDPSKVFAIVDGVLYERSLK